MYESRRFDVAGEAAARHAEAQYAVSRVLVRASDTDEAFRDLLPAIAAALGWEHAGAWLLDPEGVHLVCTHAWSQDDPALSSFVTVTRGLRGTRGQGLVGRVWDTARPMWLRDAFRLPDFRRVRPARDAGFVDGVAFPVQGATGVVAVIECFTRAIETPESDLLRLTEALGHQIGVFLDRCAAERALEEHDARYAAIVQAAFDAVIVVDDTGCITEFNPAAERLFGYARVDVVGQEMAAIIIPPDLRDAHRAGLRRWRESGESRVLERRLELRARRRDGSEFPVELTISRFPLRGRTAFIGFVRDITEQKRYEQDREALLAAEQRARMDATTASALKDEFLAALSHEMRTPLNAVLGWTHMLITNTVTQNRVEATLQTIFRNAEAQKRIVDDLLDISAFVKGQMRMEFSRLNIAEVIDGAWEALRPAAAAKGIVVTLEVRNAFVRGDRMRLQQVFWNLISNAVKFTSSQGHIAITGESDDHATTIAVSDDGVGMDPAFLPFVFDRFRQGSGVHTSAGGLGLGLSIVRQIVEAHGGSVAAASDGVGCGATFRVLLPLAKKNGAMGPGGPASAS
jgi:PAS domain S-box-containing protein